jgi:hypothetical protein
MTPGRARKRPGTRSATTDPPTPRRKTTIKPHRAHPLPTAIFQVTQARKITVRTSQALFVAPVGIRNQPSHEAAARTAVDTAETAKQATAPLTDLGDSVDRSSGGRDADSTRGGS